MQNVALEHQKMRWVWVMQDQEKYISLLKLLVLASHSVVLLAAVWLVSIPTFVDEICPHGYGQPRCH